MNSTGSQVRRESSPAANALRVAAYCVIVFAGVVAARSIIAPLLLSVFIGVIISAVLDWLRNMGMRTSVAALFMIAFVGVMGTILVSIVGSSLEDLMDSLPEQTKQLEAQKSRIIEMLQSYGMTSTAEVEAAFDSLFSIDFMRSLAGGIQSLFGYAFMVFLMVAFLMLEWSQFGAKMLAMPGNTRQAIQQSSEILSSIRQYMIIKSLVSLLTGVLIYLWLLILGIEYAAFWGALAFLLNYIPTIGSLVAGIIPTFFTLLQQGDSVIPAVNVAIAFLVVNTLIGNILEPRIMGEGLGLSTLVVFVSLVFWGWTLGPVGMLLAVPLTMTIKIVLQHDDRTQWIATLLGSGRSIRKLATQRKLEGAPEVSIDSADSADQG